MHPLPTFLKLLSGLCTLAAVASLAGCARGTSAAVQPKVVARTAAKVAQNPQCCAA